MLRAGGVTPRNRRWPSGCLPSFVAAWYSPQGNLQGGSVIAVVWQFHVREGREDEFERFLRRRWAVDRHKPAEPLVSGQFVPEGSRAAGPLPRVASTGARWSSTNGTTPTSRTRSVSSSSNVGRSCASCSRSACSTRSTCRSAPGPRGPSAPVATEVTRLPADRATKPAKNVDSLRLPVGAQRLTVDGLVCQRHACSMIVRRSGNRGVHPRTSYARRASATSCGRVSRSARRARARHGFPADLFHRLDHLAHRVTAPGTQVDGGAGAAARQVVERPDVGVGEVHRRGCSRGSRCRRAWGSRCRTRRPAAALPERGVDHERDQVRLGIVILADLAVRVRARRR